MKLQTSEEVTKYYDIVNGYIDEYINEWKILPSNLKKYFTSNKIDDFLKKNNLTEIENIKKIVEDVIDDRYAMEEDGVLKFNEFVSESIFINNSDVSHERVLADLYNVSMDHISTIDSKQHKYKVSDFGSIIDVIIYNEDDIVQFKESIIPILIKNLNSKSIDIHKVDVGLNSGKEVKFGISVYISDLLLEDKKLYEYFNSILTVEKIVQIITSYVNDYPILKSGKVYNFIKKYKNTYIWELKDKPLVLKK